MMGDMGGFSPESLTRQRRMKQIARTFFVLAILAAVGLPTLALLGLDTKLPGVWIAVSLLVLGMIITIRSDPVYAEKTSNRK
jgi:hypothetical protein